jgi:hypothetical protein
MEKEEAAIESRDRFLCERVQFSLAWSEVTVNVV